MEMLINSQSKSSIDSNTLLRIFIAVTKPKQLQSDYDRLDMQLGIAGYIIAIQLLWLISPF